MGRVALGDDLRPMRDGHREVYATAVARAREDGLRALTATALSENAGGLRLLRATGFSVVGTPSLMTELRLEL